MKHPIFIFLVSLTLILSSCNSDDDNATNDISIEGSWNLINVTGGFAGVNDDFDTGLITWSFNTDATILSVINNNTEIVIHDGFPSGDYNYSVETDGENQIITINNGSLRVVIISENDLILDEGLAADGFLYTLNR